MNFKEFSFPLNLLLYIVHLINSIIHIYCCMYGNKILLFITKLFIMPLILLIYFSLTVGKEKNKLFCLGIIFGWLGDLFMAIPHMVLGILFFFLGHIFYLITILKRNPIEIYKKKYYIYIFILIPILSFCYFLFHNYLKEGFERGNIVIPGGIYLIMLGVLNTSAFFNLIIQFNIYNILLYIGVSIFWCSDFILIRRMFYHSLPTHKYLVMTTYIIAQTLITYSISNPNKNIILQNSEIKEKINDINMGKDD